jgi:hypothetical protein
VYSRPRSSDLVHVALQFQTSWPGDWRMRRAAGKERSRSHPPSATAGRLQQAPLRRRGRSEDDRARCLATTVPTGWPRRCRRHTASALPPAQHRPARRLNPDSDARRAPAHLRPSGGGDSTASRTPTLPTASSSNACGKSRNATRPRRLQGNGADHRSTRAGSPSSLNRAGRSTKVAELASLLAVR